MSDSISIYVEFNGLKYKIKDCTMDFQTHADKSGKCSTSIELIDTNGSSIVLDLELQSAEVAKLEKL